MSEHKEVFSAGLIKEDYITVEAQALLELAAALVPNLAARARQTEIDGKVPQASIDEIAEAGLFAVLQPKRWGGAELDPRVFYRIQMILAQGCMSTAWIYGVISVHNWQLPLFPEQAQQDVWQEDRSTLIASTYMPVGRAQAVEGGFTFSGRWGFSSGCEHCEWIFLGALLPKEDGSEGVEHTTFLLPKSDFSIEKNWDVHGLQGTGSHDIVVDNVFVPAHRTQRTNNHSDAGCPGRVLNQGWLYKIPFTQVFQRAVSTACIGALDGAIEVFKQRASAHVGKHGSKTAEDPNAQFAVTAAMMTSDQLKLVMMRNYERIVNCAKSGENLEVEERLLQRAQAASVPKLCGEHADELLRACAGSGLYKSNPIERVFRDIHQARGHIANNGDAYMRAHGSVMLGLPNLDPFI
ncbi:acyl-CoA dehydrogenase family protein [Shewanella pealeana]|uniref:Acyl-CoA dehydrogenase type 2 domain n=1 Tax=Shewanella pealeana (strain ATCC 700345 / ANG-SQ1) TaxID=398579 RepID=A8H4G2_SHEPA|nr:acyl-CoA dehydrogenase family protein [Shewanella pealeana]ABV87449.1 Acyl-CoA dehydrogenase type 2 domain [Shewanella pealeana ATCC 700345]